MNEKNFTSSELSQKILITDFEKESKYVWCVDVCGQFLGEMDEDGNLPTRDNYESFLTCPAYDILNDLCVKYGEEIFVGDAEERFTHMGMIFHMMISERKEEAEKYFEEHCILFKQSKS